MTNNKLTDERLQVISLDYQDSEIDAMAQELQEYRNAAPVVPNDYLHLKNVQELYHSVERELFALTKRITPAFDAHNDSCSDAIRELERHIFGGTVDEGAAVRATVREDLAALIGGLAGDLVRSQNMFGANCCGIKSVCGKCGGHLFEGGSLPCTCAKP